MSCTDGRELLAFLDESQSDRRLDPHCYVLAAGLCRPEEAPALREALASLRLRGQKKLHWRDEEPKRRRILVEAIAQLPLQHLLIVRDGRAGESSERRRRHCLERMLYELDELEVATATFESRGRADDRRDRTMVDALRAKKSISSELRVDHLPGPQDALLWVPDTVCGALTHHRTGDVDYLKILTTRVPVNIITLTSP